MSVFERIPEGTQDATFALMEAYAADTADKKVNLTPGFYRDDNSKSWVLPAVKKARETLQADADLNHDLSPLLGHGGFVSVARTICFGDALEGRAVASLQTISGTGANHFIAQFLSDCLQPKAVWISDPTWDNHKEIWRLVNPSIKRRLYPYYDYKSCGIDSGMISTLKKQASRGDVVILHACAHNPTGVDPSKELWEAIANVCQEKGLFPIFDMAYQGFATADIDNDAWAVRNFSTRSNGTMEFAVAQSFSKSFGLYGERVGALHLVLRNHDTMHNVQAALKKIVRAEITSAPSFGAKIVEKIVQTPELRQQWQRDLQTMTTRLAAMRQRLHDALRDRNTPGNWDHILTDIGMFSMIGLSQDQVSVLRDIYHIYILPNSRLSITGLTESNVDYVAESIHRVATALAEQSEAKPTNLEDP